jgi:hypothetical protein
MPIIRVAIKEQLVFKLMPLHNYAHAPTHKNFWRRQEKSILEDHQHLYLVIYMLTLSADWMHCFHIVVHAATDGLV